LLNVLDDVNRAIYRGRASRILGGSQEVMMTPLLAWVLAACEALAPGRSHEQLAGAIASRVESEAPLFKADEDKKKTASFLVAIAFRESSLKWDVTGDMHAGKPTSFCAYQIHLPYGAKTPEGWTGQDLIEDPNKCVTTAMRMLRESFRSCPAHPLAWYAEGPRGCESERAQRISRDRMAIAQRLVREIPQPEDEEQKAKRRAEQVQPAAPRPRRFCAP
jgi:hypothetical protein